MTYRKEVPVLVIGFVVDPPAKMDSDNRAAAGEIVHAGAFAADAQHDT